MPRVPGNQRRRNTGNEAIANTEVATYETHGGRSGERAPSDGTGAAKSHPHGVRSAGGSNSDFTAEDPGGHHPARRPRSASPSKDRRAPRAPDVLP